MYIACTWIHLFDQQSTLNYPNSECILAISAQDTQDTRAESLGVAVCRHGWSFDIYFTFLLLFDFNDAIESGCL